MITSEAPGTSAPAAAKRADPCVMAVFGASGDLTQRKLIPALYNLAVQGLLADGFSLVGISRRAISHEDFRRKMVEGIEAFVPKPIDGEVLKKLSSHFYYLAGDIGDADTYKRLGALSEELDQKHGGAGRRLYYLATAPEFFGPVARALGAAGHLKEDAAHWRRVVVEKPFGRDLASARALNAELRSVLHESQIYRIDHYLGKETVQNIMVFRFANGIFEPIWNRRYVDHIQITVAEDIGVGSRGGYFDGSGIMRDMVPNHIFQLISLTAMEPPISFDADAVRNKQLDVLKSIAVMKPEDVLHNCVRGQYGPGQLGTTDVAGYRSEPLVSPESDTETFTAMKLTIDSWRWAGVPFYLRVGKRLPVRTTEIVVQFRKAPFTLFRQTEVENLPPNQLVLRIQPQEGIALSFDAKVPGPIVKLGVVNMDFRYQNYFGERPSTGYERLLYDAMLGDATLFQRADMVEAAWGVVQPILDVWKALPARDFPNYSCGQWGPVAADELLTRDGRHWRPSDA